MDSNTPLDPGASELPPDILQSCLYLLLLLLMLAITRKIYWLRADILCSSDRLLYRQSFWISAVIFQRKFEV